LIRGIDQMSLPGKRSVSSCRSSARREQFSLSKTKLRGAVPSQFLDFHVTLLCSREKPPTPRSNARSKSRTNPSRRWRTSRVAKNVGRLETFFLFFLSLFSRSIVCLRRFVISASQSYTFVQMRYSPIFTTARLLLLQHVAPSLSLSLSLARARSVSSPEWESSIIHSLFPFCFSFLSFFFSSSEEAGGTQIHGL